MKLKDNAIESPLSRVNSGGEIALTLSNSHSSYSSFNHLRYTSGSRAVLEETRRVIRLIPEIKIAPKAPSLSRTAAIYQGRCPLSKKPVLDKPETGNIS